MPSSICLLERPRVDRWASADTPRGSGASQGVAIAGRQRTQAADHRRVARRLLSLGIGLEGDSLLVKIGLSLPNNWGVVDVGDLIEIGMLAEQCGFHALWTSEHFTNVSYVRDRIGDAP